MSGPGGPEPASRARRSAAGNAGVTRELRLLVAPDSFKGSLTSVQVADAIAMGWARGRPRDTLDRCPASDGGTGLLDAIHAADPDWQVLPAMAEDPLGRPVAARFLRSGDRAVVELADASGLGRVAPAERDPDRASTFGTGLTIAAAIGLGVRDVILGAGGSATTDGGAGLLAALGARFLDAGGRELPPGGAALARLARIDLDGLAPALRDVRLVVASDVINPLLGDRGAAAVYGPQKGASPAQVRMLDAALAHYADVLEAATGRTVREVPGAGAAGGTVAGLLAVADRVASLAVRPGFDVVAGLVRFDERLTRADLVLSGEGRVDAQTAFGKTALAVAQRAHASGLPCVVIAGSIEPDGAGAFAARGATVVPAHDRLITTDDAMAAGPQPIARAAERVARVLTLGIELGSVRWRRAG